MNKKIIIIISLIIFSIAFIINEKLTKNDYESIKIENIVESTNNFGEDNNQLIEEKEYIKIHITGQINLPGILELKQGERIADAIEKAGGLTELANIEDVNLAYELQDGQKVYIPKKGEKINEYVAEENGEGIIEDTNTYNKSKKIDINRASEEELQNIPGVGPSMAQKIITYRKENGDYKKIDDLKNVSGIGEKKFESMKEYIVVK